MAEDSVNLSRELTVEASFKFITAADFPAKDIKWNTTRWINDVSVKRLMLKGRDDPEKFKTIENTNLQIEGEENRKVALLIFKLAAVPDNNGLVPVYVKQSDFNPRSTNNGAQKLEKDNTAVFWSAYFGDPEDEVLIGVAPNEDGSFWYYNENARHAVVDVIVGYVNVDANENGDDDEETPPEAAEVYGKDDDEEKKKKRKQQQSD